MVEKWNVFEQCGRHHRRHDTNLVFSPLRTGDAGSYAVVIANGYGSITSSVAVLTVTLDKTVPTVTITSPAANARTNAPVFKEPQPTT